MSQSHLHPPVHRATAGSLGVGLSSLATALERETKLLEDLLEILELQRRAVAAEDLAGVDDTIFSAQRVLRTLAQARVKRRTLLELLGWDPDLTLDELEELLGPRLTPEISGALDTLRTVALTLTGELETNRKILDTALRSGEDLIRVMGGGEGRDPGLYGPQAEKPPASGDHGVMIDRQI